MIPPDTDTALLLYVGITEVSFLKIISIINITSTSTISMVPKNHISIISGPGAQRSFWKRPSVTTNLPDMILSGRAGLVAANMEAVQHLAITYSWQAFLQWLIQTSSSISKLDLDDLL